MHHKDNLYQIIQVHLLPLETEIIQQFGDKFSPQWVKLTFEYAITCPYLVSKR